MNCLSKEQVQMYIDGELQPGFICEAKEHINSCSICSEIFNELYQNKQMLEKSLAYLNPDKIEIPPARIRTTGRRKKINIGYKIIKYAAVACATILLIINIPFKYKTVNANESAVLINEYFDSQDRNDMWQNNENAIIIQTEEGKLVDIISN